MAYKGVLLPKEDEVIKEKIRNEETTFSWETYIWSYSYGNNFLYLRELIMFFPLIFGLVICQILSLTNDVTNKEMLYINLSVVIGMLFFGLLIRVYVISDMKCTFFLKNSGILVKEKRVLSNYSTWFIKIIGFLGAVICLIAFFYIGPLAFSGAGMFAIFTIKLIKYQSSERVKSIICFDEMIGFSIKGKNIITMVSNPFDTCENIYFSKEDKELVFSNLTKNYNFINFYEVNKINDVLSHPAKLESGKARRKIQEEMRSLGMDV